MKNTTLVLSLWCSALLINCPALNAAETGTATKGHSQATVEKRPFGAARSGEPVDLYTIRNANGVTAKVMTYGAVIYSLEVPDKDGKFLNVTANRETLADYEQRSACFGSLVGRYANRIAKAKFTLDGKEYSLARNGGPNHIHGGNRGFDKRVWKGEAVEGKDFVGVKLTYVSPDGEENYPGTVTCTVTYELNNQNEWKMDYRATTDKPTPINLSNHAYWNLAGAQSGTILDQVLTVNAEQYLPADDTLIPTGELAPVEGTPLDFRTPHAIGERIDQIKGRQFGGGYDHCYVVKRAAAGQLVLCAKLHDPKSGRTMEVFTTQPGVQLYTANFAGGSLTGPDGYRYPEHLGACLETQHFPDSPNQPQFPSTILRPGETFHETTVHKFGLSLK
jgi:aldose 1-epimerase